MNGNQGFVTNSSFNRYVNLDNIEWHIVDYLVNDQSKYADYLWKLLKYNTEDCLNLPSVEKSERLKLIYTSNGDSTPYRVFMSPYTDDAWEEQSAHLHIYVSNIVPQTHITSIVSITFECIVHNKIVNICGDASEYNERTNPVEIHDGKYTTPYKSRVSVFVKCILAALNGVFVNGVGVLQFNQKLSDLDKSNHNLWNTRKFLGHQLVMSTMLTGVSECDECGD